MGAGTRNMHKRLLLLGTTKHNFFTQNCNSGGIMDSINVFDSPSARRGLLFYWPLPASRNSISVRFSHRRPERHTDLSHPFNCLHNFSSSVAPATSRAFSLRKSLSRRRKLFLLTTRAFAVVIFRNNLNQVKFQFKM